MEGELGFLSILIPTISFWFLDAILLTPLAFKLSGLGGLKPYFTDFPNSYNSQLHNTFYFTLTKKMDMIAEVKYNESPSDTLPVKLKVYKIPAICYICVDVLILGPLSFLVGFLTGYYLIAFHLDKKRWVGIAAIVICSSLGSNLYAR